ncbi:TetR/AcrR family transcriptional regulator [Amycolatopsis suaedae]|uniref:TetR/AcrR family transcriptional regulator n=1 Tax=Amycolatopsis suaedae TaxID=2510978 RepID=A0A4Q7IXU2_9PSEU|nr:TetR/AcrR family transcriptional regulator [Amycolatopsis suaedae]RZQ59771.1 TetR/AcrR family transcriptional regulator [Amycolatopsis suaedae]
MKPLRRDAQRNRDLIVAAAAEVFGARGVDAPLEEIARKAGVAIGTLYNRFPQRTDLIEAVFTGPIVRLADDAEQAARAADPWQGFTGFVERACRTQVVDTGFGDVCARTFTGAPELEAAKRRILDGIVALLERGQAAGVLRGDLVAADVARAIAATSALRGMPGWERNLALQLDGFRPQAAVGPLPD